MSGSFEDAVAWAQRRRVLVFAVAAVLLAVSGVGLRRITFDANVLRLLPARGEAVPAFRAFLEQFGTLDDLYVVFTAPDGQAIDEYDEEIAAWSEALRALPELTRVESGRVDDSRDWSWLLDRELLLLDDAPLTEALERLQPAHMTATLQATRELLAVPSAEIAAMVRDDPLRLHELLRQRFGGGGSTLPIAATGDGYLSADGRQRLIVARPSQEPYDTGFSHRLFEQLNALERGIRTRPVPEGTEPRAPVGVTFAGGHRIAVESEAVVKRESIVNGIGSLALILPMLFFVFRSAWLVVIGALPSAVALLVVLGLMGHAGVTLSAAATGASAMLFGLGVDGVVLLYVAHHHALAEGRDPQSAIRSLGGPAASMLLGMWTTAATFLGLLVVDFPSLEQLGLLIGLSMLVCGVMTLLMVPAALPARPDARRVRSLSLPGVASFVTRRRRAVLLAAGVATAGLAYFASTIQVNFTLDRLRSVTPGAQMVEDVTRAFGLPGEVLVVVAQGSDLQRLLESNETLTARLRRDIPGVPVHAPSALLPSDAAQTERLRRIRGAIDDVNRVRAALDKAGSEAGFKASSFDRFADRLPRMVRQDQRVTWEGLAEHGLDDLAGRFVRRQPAGWSLATYVFPASAGDVDVVKAAVRSTPGAGVLTGLPVVNDELSAGFMPQFAWGLAVGSAVVLLSILVTFRDLGLSLLTLVPTVVGLTWAAGVLGIAGFELDLFSVFAVITFVGIGVDYGIHLVHRYRERGDAAMATAELAPVILVAGAITLFGYGTLMASSYPPLQSIGLVSAVSVVTLVIASVFVLPALLQRNSS